MPVNADPCPSDDLVDVVAVDHERAHGVDHDVIEVDCLFNEFAYGVAYAGVSPA